MNDPTHDHLEFIHNKLLRLKERNIELKLHLNYESNNNLNFTIMEEKEIPTTKILKKRIGNELHLANKGCRSLIGITEKINNKFYIKGYLNEFDKEQEAIDVLSYGFL